MRRRNQDRLRALAPGESVWVTSDLHGIETATAIDGDLLALTPIGADPVLFADHNPAEQIVRISPQIEGWRIWDSLDAARRASEAAMTRARSIEQARQR